MVATANWAAQRENNLQTAAQHTTAERQTTANAAAAKLRHVVQHRYKTVCRIRFGYSPPRNIPPEITPREKESRTVQARKTTPFFVIKKKRGTILLTFKMNTLCIVLLVSLTGYVRSVVVNGECETGDAPAACNDGLYCEDSKCKVKVDETCTTDPDDQCIMGATCVSSMCKCMVNHTANADMTKCLINIGGVCAESMDCVQGSPKVLCTNKMCACTAMYAPNDMMNMCKLKLNETCSADEDCGMNAMCSTGTSRKCACKVNFTPTGNTCVSGSAAVVASLFLLVAAFVTSRLMFTRDE